MLQGQKYRRVAEEAMDPLTVTALALESERVEEAVVLVSCDLVAVTDGLIETVRDRVQGQVPELSGDRIVACATHTHTSLVLTDGHYEHPGGDVMTPAECEQLVAGRTVEAIVEAWERRQPRSLGRAFVNAVIGHNRYAVYADGHAELYGDADREGFVGFGGSQDHSVDVLFSWDPDGTLVGVVLAIPCPAQVDEHRERFSADYWHDVRVDLRTRFGEDLAVLPLCGAAGDQSPHRLIHADEEDEMRGRRSVTERQEIARRVADAVEDALAYTKPDPDQEPVLIHAVNHLELPQFRISEEDRAQARTAYERELATDDRDNWWARSLEDVMDGDFANDGEPVTVESHVVRLGDLAIATNPFELFIDYGHRIEARSPAAQTVAVQLACGNGKYLPTKTAHERGGYGATPVVADVGPAGGNQLVEETLATIEELFRT